MNYTEDDVANCGVLKSRIKIGSSLADVDPMAIDRNVTQLKPFATMQS